MNANSLRSDMHRVGAGLSVRFSCVADRVDVEWSPRPPTKREAARVLPRYREARNGFLAEWSKRTGRSVVCLEL